MVETVDGGAGRIPAGFEQGRQRYVTAFSIGYFVLCQVAGPLLHYALNPTVPYWLDPLPLLAHALGTVVVGLLVFAPKRATLTAYALIWASWITVWVAVWAALGTADGERMPFYLAAVPLLAGILLSAPHVVIVGSLNVLGIAALGALRWVEPATALNAGLLTIAATMILGIGAYTRHVDMVTIGGQARQLISRTAELEAIMEATSDGMVAVDGAGRIVNANPAAVRLIGGASLQRGAPLMGSLPMLVADVVEELEESGTRIPRDIELGERTLRIWLRQLPGQREGHLVTIQDATEQRAADEQRRLAEGQRSEIEKLQEVTRFKANLLNAASHELNTPLTPVRLQMELLRSPDRGPLTEKQLRSLDILDRNIRRLSGLVSDIMDVAKLGGARLPLRCVPVSLGTVIIDEVGGFQDNAHSLGLTLDVEVDEGVWVWGDPARLGQVVAHMISNAIKFTNAGGVHVAFTVDEGWATVSVTDTGVGVPEGFVGSLFEPFAQMNELGRDLEGAGMGLHISRGIIEAHGGTMGYERHEQGSRFWFRMPTDAVVAQPPNEMLAR